MQDPGPPTKPLALRHESGYWEDEYGALGPAKPGLGPRKDPVGDFSTGPEIGQPFPGITATSHVGRTIDVHADRAGRPMAFVFYRSAVW